MYFGRLTDVFVLAALSGIPFAMAQQHGQGMDVAPRIPHGFSGIPKFARSLSDSLEFKSRAKPKTHFTSEGDSSSSPTKSIDVSKEQDITDTSLSLDKGGLTTSISQNEKRWWWKKAGAKKAMHRKTACTCPRHPGFGPMPVPVPAPAPTTIIVGREASPSPWLTKGKAHGCACAPHHSLLQADPPSKSPYHSFASAVKAPVTKAKAVTASAERPVNDKMSLRFAARADDAPAEKSAPSPSSAAAAATDPDLDSDINNPGSDFLPDIVEALTKGNGNGNGNGFNFLDALENGNANPDTKPDATTSAPRRTKAGAADISSPNTNGSDPNSNGDPRGGFQDFFEELIDRLGRNRDAAADDDANAADARDASPVTKPTTTNNKNINDADPSTGRNTTATNTKSALVPAAPTSTSSTQTNDTNKDSKNTDNDDGTARKDTDTQTAAKAADESHNAR